MQTLVKVRDAIIEFFLGGPPPAVIADKLCGFRLSNFSIAK